MKIIIKFTLLFSIKLLIGIIFIIAALIANKYIIISTLLYFLVYLIIDLYSYLDGKFNYPNNIFLLNKNS